MYCVPVFDSHMLHKYFGRQRLLPITHKEKSEGGGSAARYKIKLYGPHNKLIPVGSETVRLFISFPSDSFLGVHQLTNLANQRD